MISIFVDGSCKLNLPNKPGTCAFVVVNNDKIVDEYSFLEENTTNNRMEITALYRALEYVWHNTEDSEQVTICLDSQYVQRGIENWINKWKQNGWKTGKREPVLNQDIWEKLDYLYKLVKKNKKLTLEWVKGHADSKYNNRADKLCTEAYNKENNSNNTYSKDNPLAKEVVKQLKENRIEQQIGDRHKAVLLVTIEVFKNKLEEANALLLSLYNNTNEHYSLFNYLHKNKLIKE